MLTEFGKALRKIRIDEGEILKNMADKLSITSAYLSAIEVGKRNIPDDLIERISELYSLDEEKVKELKAAADLSIKSVTMDIDDVFDLKRQTALKFARSFDNMDEQTAGKIFKILQKSKEGMSD